MNSIKVTNIEPEKINVNNIPPQDIKISNGNYIVVEGPPGPAGPQGPGNIYSTTETVIGTFLGKPLYQKMITFDNIVSSTPITIPHNISNLDVIASIEGVMYNTNNPFGGGRICYPIPFNTAPSENASVGVRVYDNNIEISSGSGMAKNYHFKIY